MMKKTLFLVCLITSLLPTLAQPSNETNKLEIKINKNVELLGLAYFIGFEGVDIENKTVEVDGRTLPKKEWHNYGYKIYKQYNTFATSENLATCFSVADHLWLDYITAFLLQVDDVPNAKLSDSIKEGFYLNFSKEKNIEEAKKNAEIFLNGLNAFSKEIDFEAYLSESKEYYEKSIDEIQENLPNKSFIEIMEAFYKEGFDEYLLVPSLTIPKGMGFGIKIMGDTETQIYNVFGALDVQEFETKNELKMGFANRAKIRELSVHEFGHSFVNPVVGSLPNILFTETEHLFESIKSAMDNQGYNTWKVCVYEHFVRAGEIIIAEKIGEKETATTLLNEYQKTRQFKYLPEILSELKIYDNGEYASYYETVEITMKKLAKF